MFIKFSRVFLVLVSLLFVTACVGVDGSDDTVTVSIQGEFEKKSITSSGISAGVIIKPTRHCWVEGFDPQTGHVYFDGYLNSMGLGIADVPRDARFQVRLIARYEVPGRNNYGNFRMRGSVKNGTMSPTYNDTGSFNATPDWFVSSETFTGSRDLNIVIRAMDSAQNIEAGAFNIADQAVEFALKMGELESGLGLPNLHSFWSIDNQHTDYPRVAFNRQYTPLMQSTNRIIFQHKIMGVGNARTNGRADEFNDSALMESFAHLLFADYSYPRTGTLHPYDRIIRRDSEEAAWVDRQIASEPATAFVNGFCDFISAAFRNNPQLIDIYPDNNYSYNLNSATTFPKIHGGEFYRQSVAAALYRTWTNGFGGTSGGLKTMWEATFAQGMAKDTTSAVYPFGYLQCPVGNISSYLSGLSNGYQFGVTASVWNSVLNVLSSESMGAPNANYFNQGVYWKKLNIFPAIETGTIQTYPDASGIFWDIDQARSYNFTHNSGSRRIVLEMTGGQDLFLELFDDQGIIEERTNYTGSLANREISLSSLRAGNYVVRVRAGYTTQERLAGFRLTVQ